MAKSRNIRGQVTHEHNIEVHITKKLLARANEVAVRIKPMVRDELEQTIRSEIYDSYTPATERGKEIQTYNETHKHQQARAYHHTGLLLQSTRCVIDRKRHKSCCQK